MDIPGPKKFATKMIIFKVVLLFLTFLTVSCPSVTRVLPSGHGGSGLGSKVKRLSGLILGPDSDDDTSSDADNKAVSTDVGGSGGIQSSPSPIDLSSGPLSSSTTPPPASNPSSLSEQLSTPHPSSYSSSPPNPEVSVVLPTSSPVVLPTSSPVVTSTSFGANFGTGGRNEISDVNVDSNPYEGENNSDEDNDGREDNESGRPATIPPSFNTSGATGLQSSDANQSELSRTISATKRNEPNIKPVDIVTNSNASKLEANQKVLAVKTKADEDLAAEKAKAEALAAKTNNVNASLLAKVNTINALKNAGKNNGKELKSSGTIVTSGTGGTASEIKKDSNSSSALNTSVLATIVLLAVLSIVVGYILFMKKKVKAEADVEAETVTGDESAEI